MGKGLNGSTQGALRCVGCIIGGHVYLRASAGKLKKVFSFSEQLFLLLVPIEVGVGLGKCLLLSCLYSLPMFTYYWNLVVCAGKQEPPDFFIECSLFRIQEIILPHLLHSAFLKPGDSRFSLLPVRYLMLNITHHDVIQQFQGSVFISIFIISLLESLFY